MFLISKDSQARLQACTSFKETVKTSVVVGFEIALNIVLAISIIASGVAVGLTFFN